MINRNQLKYITIRMNDFYCGACSGVIQPLYGERCSIFIVLRKEAYWVF